MSMSSVRDETTGASASAPTRRFDGTLLARALLLAAVGFTITFTAPLHENLAFNRVVFVALCAGLSILGAARFFFAPRAAGASSHDRSTFIVAAIALCAGTATLLAEGPAAFAFIVALWAALGALIELWHGLRTGHREAVTAGVLSGLLAILVTIGGGDVVAVVGFLGAYGILAGVYLAIAAFDISPAAGVTPARATPLDTEIAGS